MLLVWNGEHLSKERLMARLGLVLGTWMALLVGAGMAQNPVIVVSTNLGDMKIELYQDKAPKTVKNFLAYVDRKHYDGLIFHRVIPSFMIQGGGYDASMMERRTDPPIVNESSNGLSNKRGTLAMARTPIPDSATSQFFINVVDNGRLDKAMSPDGVGYCVFGKVLEGMDVADKIRALETIRDKPTVDAVIKSIRRQER
jgi:cyclophilin family peptidyl-prolyl cis-trans isomerase